MEGSFLSHFSNLPDRRVLGRSSYPLIEILFLTISAVVSGCEGWEEIEEFGLSKLCWLRKYLPYKSGIPKHDTIARVISSLSPKAFQTCFISWISAVSELTAGEVVAIDGKTARRSYNRRSRQAAIHMVSAWACSNGVVLGQEKTSEKSNEITAIPKLLALLELKGCIVTLDAMGCQRDIAENITEKEADYVLAVKSNQKALHEDIVDYFSMADGKPVNGVYQQSTEKIDAGHGRIETRKCTVCEIPAYLSCHQKTWAGLRSFVCIQSTRELAQTVEKETRYYISSLKPDAIKIAHTVRQHWRVENSLHWVLDVTFGEDDSRIRRGDAPQNMTMLRHLTLNLLKKEKSKASIKRKRFKALLYDDFRHKVLFNKEF